MLRPTNRTIPPPSEKRLHMHTPIIVSQICPFDDGFDNLWKVYLLAGLVQTLILEHLHFQSVNPPWPVRSRSGHRS